MDDEEKSIKKLYIVKDIFPSVLVVSQLSNNHLIEFKIVIMLSY